AGPVDRATVRQAWPFHWSRNMSKLTPAGPLRQPTCWPALARNEPLLGRNCRRPAAREPVPEAPSPEHDAGVAEGAGAGAPEPVVTSVKLLSCRISFTGWKNVVPPTVQSPE